MEMEIFTEWTLCFRHSAAIHQLFSALSNRAHYPTSHFPAFPLSLCPYNKRSSGYLMAFSRTNVTRNKKRQAIPGCSEVDMYRTSVIYRESFRHVKIIFYCKSTMYFVDKTMMYLRNFQYNIYTYFATCFDSSESSSGVKFKTNFT